jgi:hypothetical protein
LFSGRGLARYPVLDLQAFEAAHDFHEPASFLNQLGLFSMGEYSRMKEISGRWILQVKEQDRSIGDTKGVSRNHPQDDGISAVR